MIGYAIPKPAPPTVRVEQDDHYEAMGMSPREWSNLGTMVCSHRRYDLGDERSPDEWVEAYAEGGFAALAELVRKERGATVVLPLGLYDHGGISMYVGAGPHTFDTGGWDSGLVGVIFDTPEGHGELFGPIHKGGPITSDRTTLILESEVDVYDRYLRGDVLGYVVEGEGGDVLDSCWGFYDELEYVQQEGEAAAEAAHRRALATWQRELDQHNARLTEASATYAFNPGA